MTDEELVKGCLSNDPAAQKALFERFSRKMLGVCMRYACCREEAEDLLQNGFIKVFRKIGLFRGDGSLEGWIRKIMINESLSWLRGNRQFKLNVKMDEVQHELASGNHAAETVHVKDLLKLIQTLPAGYRAVFNLYAIEGYSHKEIALLLDITEGTSKSQYAKAKEQLQKKLSESGQPFKEVTNEINTEIQFATDK